MSTKRNLAIGIILSTATAIAVLAAPTPPEPDSALQTEANIPASSTNKDFGNCAYVWAYKDAPELSTLLDGEVKAFNPKATAHAQFFGEDCLHSDGSISFGAMETDFYVRLPVDDITQTEEFGNFAAQVMKIVSQIPREKLGGPNYGFVEFTFEKNETEQLTLRVPIQKYLDDAKDLTGTELFNTFYSPP